MSRLPILLLLFLWSILADGQVVVHRSGQKQVTGVEGVGTLFEVESRSVIQCVVTCMGTPQCTAVTVTSASSPGSPVTCRGHGDLRSLNSTSSPASRDVWHLPHTAWLEKNCSSDVECGGGQHRECFAGVCLCSPGYYFSHSLNSCVTNCSTEDLQSRMLTYPSRYIRYFNIGNCPYVTSLQACLSTCAQNAQARTCDLRYASPGWFSCCLQAVTKREVPAKEWVTSATSWHHQKTCA